jgi:hypothetical protein
MMLYQTRDIGIVFDDKDRAFHRRILAVANLINAPCGGNFAKSLLILC